jgi:PAS domain S-box-containing protein
MVASQSDGVSQASEQRYRHLFKNLPICIFIVDLMVIPAVILEVNRQTELVYGYTASELIGKPVTQLVPEESRAFIHDILRRVQRGETVTSETTNRHRDGTTFPVRATTNLDPTNKGHMIVTMEDITAEKKRRSEAEAIDADRLRIAHEIHDGVAQNLGGLRLKSALWSHLAETAPPGMRSALDELQTVLTAAIEDMRRAIFALRPVDLESMGFMSALTQLVADFEHQNQLSAKLDISAPQYSLPVSYELPLYRIIQEGLNNIIQHARASSVLVRLRVDAMGGVGLSLRDNGRGFDPGLLSANSQFGLRHMRERTLARGGTLDVHSAIGKGTELLVTLPPLIKEVNDVSD